MSSRKQRHLSPAGFLLALALLIVGIFAADYVYRLFFRSSTENIIGTGGFSTTSSSAGTASEDGENATDSTEETRWFWRMRPIPIPALLYGAIFLR